MVKPIRILAVVCFLSGSSVSAVSSADSLLGQDWSSIKDLYLSETLYFSYQKKYFSSLKQLLLAKQQGRMTQPNETELLLAALYIAYGMHEQAERVLLPMLGRNLDRNLANGVLIQLAQLQVQRARYNQAGETLGRVFGVVDPGLETQRRALLAQVLVHEGKYKEAIKLLDGVKESGEWGYYLRYQIAMAMLGANFKDGAAPVMKQILEYRGDDQELLALRDQANLALGLAYLNDAQANKAKSHFRQIRLDGPVSNKALLSLGWAYKNSDDMKAALVAWSRLDDMTSADPSVQEGLIATSYAYTQLGAYSQAVEHYQKVINAFDAQLRAVDKAIESVGKGELIRGLLATNGSDQRGWQRDMQYLAKGPEQAYLSGIFAGNLFQEGVKNLQDCQFLHDQLVQWETIVASFSDMLKNENDEAAARSHRAQIKLLTTRIELYKGQVNGTLEQQAEFLTEIALNELEKQKKRITRLHALSRLGLAKTYETAARAEEG